MKSSYHVEFRDSQNFMFFEATRVVRDTWHLMGGLRGATCKSVSKSNIELKWGSHETPGIMPFGENLKVDG